MKKMMALKTLLLCIIAILFTSEIVFAHSASVTTTIIITVKRVPENNLKESDENHDMLREVAKAQSMANPYIKEEVEDTTLSGEKIYTITDRL